MRRRTIRSPGFSLIETLVVMAVGSAMTGIAVGVLYMLLGLERDGREQLRFRDTIARLSRQFREDVHAARGFDGQIARRPAGKAEADAKGAREERRTWTFELPDGHTVRYAWLAEELVRTDEAGGKPVSREGFGLAPGATVSIEAVAVEPGMLIRLKISPAAAPGDVPTLRETQIDAEFAHDCWVSNSKWGPP